MLVLKFTRDNPLRIVTPAGEVIWLHVPTAEMRDWIRIGVEAPAAVRVRRNEILPEAERYGQKEGDPCKS